MRILVTFAVEAEFAPWRKRHSFQLAAMDGPRLSPFLSSYQTDLQGITVDVLLTGMGWEDSACNGARDDLRRLFTAKPDLCVSTGLAGGLKPEWKCGDVIAVEEIGSYQSEAVVRSQQSALQVAKNCGAKIAHKLMTWNHVVSETRAKQAMGAFADIVDMESYFVLTMAAGVQIPAIAVRAVSDSSDQELPVDFSRVTDRQGHVIVKQLFRELVGNPGRIPGLLAFGRRSRTAISTLADFLDDFIPSLADHDGRAAASAYGQVAAQ